jgi:hypothetical protein
MVKATRCNDVTGCINVHDAAMTSLEVVKIDCIRSCLAQYVRSMPRYRKDIIPRLDELLICS